jgi:cephalosporin-C deacetylase
MPLLDMPLNELKNYTGRNPKPADFDDFWARALAEMKATEARFEIIPATFQTPFADFYELYFTGVGGARIRAKYARPKNAKEPHPAIVTFHGYSGNSGDWTWLLQWLSLGFSAASMDCRGQGGISEDVGGVKGTTLKGHFIRGLDDIPEKLLYRSIFLDCCQLVNIIMNMPEVDGDRVGVTGMSQGGGLTLAAAALEPRLKKAAPICPFLSDYQRVWEMDLAEGAYEELKYYFRMFDPLHERQDQIFNRLGYIDVHNLADRIRGEVLMGTGLMDRICPPSTQFAAYNRIPSKKSVLIYPDYGHEIPPAHGDRVFEFMSSL